MSAADTALDDLAFLKGLVEAGDRNQARMGEAFVGGGLIYGVQGLVWWASDVFAWPLGPWGNVALGALPSILFCGVVAWVARRDRQPRPGGAVSRAVRAAFIATGVTNLALLCLFVPAAVSRQSLVIWELYPAVVFALQGGAWATAFMLRRRLWLGVVALGWFATAVGLGLTLATSSYLLIVGLGLLAWMAAPGFVMIRLAHKGA